MCDAQRRAMIAEAQLKAARADTDEWQKTARQRATVIVQLEVISMTLYDDAC